MVPRLLVVGGSGFIGQYVVRKGVYLGWNVTSVGLHTRETSSLTPGANHAVADMAQAASLAKLGDNRFDYVVNLGGYIDHTLFSSGGRSLISSHFDGLLNLIEFLDRTTIKRFVQIGSSDEYGDGPAPQHENLREQPISPYSVGKAAATHFLQMLHRTEAFPAVVLRLFLTYGPGQDERRVLPQIIRGCLQDREFPVSAGGQLRDFCYAEDTARAIFLALDAESVKGEVLNVGSGIPITIRSVIERICSIIGKGRPQYGRLPYRAGENGALYANTEKIRRLIGWIPEVALDEGLRLTIESIKQSDD